MHAVLLLSLAALCLLSFCSVNVGLIWRYFYSSEDVPDPEPQPTKLPANVTRPHTDLTPVVALDAAGTSKIYLSSGALTAPAPPSHKKEASGYMALAFEGELEGAGARKRLCLAWQGFRGSNVFYEWRECELVDKAQIFKMEGPKPLTMEVKGFDRDGVVAGGGIKLSNLAGGKGLCLSFAGAQMQPIGIDCESPDASVFLLKGDSMFRLHRDGSMDCMTQGTRTSPIFFRPGACHDTEHMIFPMNIPDMNVEHALRNVVE